KFAQHCGTRVCPLRVQSDTRIKDLPVSCDSEVRIEACGKGGRTSESGHRAGFASPPDHGLCWRRWDFVSGAKSTGGVCMRGVRCRANARGNAASRPEKPPAG